MDLNRKYASDSYIFSEAPSILYLNWSIVVNADTCLLVTMYLSEAFWHIIPRHLSEFMIMNYL
jgi:hypothetical protein